MSEFERWVSLGNYCLTKYQINRHVARRFLGLQENSTLEAVNMISRTSKETVHALNGGNLFFDWVVVENYAKVASLLKDGFSYDLAKAELSENRPDGKNLESIRCLSSGVLWVHLFDVSPSSGDWREQIQALKPKVDHMRDEFLHLRHFSTLYIVFVSPDLGVSAMPDDLEAALAELRRGSEKEFRLLICMDGGQEIPDRGRIAFRVHEGTPDNPQYPWLGSAEAWDRVFRGFELRGQLKRVEHRLIPGK